MSLALAVAFAGLVNCLQRTDFFLGFGRSRVAVTESHPPPPRVQSQVLGDVAVEERLHSLSQWEADTAAELRRRLAEAGLGPVPEGLVQRCARASEGDIEQAYAQLRDIIRWRQRDGVDSILDRPEAIADEHWYRRILQYGLPGKDRQGRAVMIEAVGQWDMAALDRASRERREVMLRSHVVVCETLLREAQESAGAEAVEGGAVPRIRGFVAVLDMKGISLAQNPMGFPELLNTLKEISKINARYYPEAIEHVFVVNAPSVFRVIWKALAPFVLPTSGVQLDVLRTGQFGPLVRELGKDVLPEQLGGSLPANTAPYGQE